MKPIVVKAYIEKLRDGECARREQLCTDMAGRTKDVNARTLSARDYVRLKNDVLGALRGRAPDRP